MSASIHAAHDRMRAALRSVAEILAMKVRCGVCGLVWLQSDDCHTCPLCRAMNHRRVTCDSAGLG